MPLPSPSELCFSPHAHLIISLVANLKTPADESFPMATNHPNYPPLLPRTVLRSPLSPLPREVRVALTQRLQQRRHCQITRGFLAALNLNLLYAAPMAEQQQVHAWLRGLSERGLTRLAQSFTAALRQCNGTVLLVGRQVADSMFF